MGRVYSAGFTGVTVSAAQDLFQMSAPSDAVVMLHGVVVSNDASETSEMLRFTIQRASSGGTNTTSLTPAPMEVGDAAFGGGVSRSGGSSGFARAAVSGTLTLLRGKSENILNGVEWLFTPETRPVVSPNSILIVGIETAPSSELTMSAELTFEEIGG